MKILVNLIILAIIAGGAVYFYEQNRDELNKTLDEAKNMSVESVTDTLVDKVKNMDPKELLDLAVENKELVKEYLDENNITIDNIDFEALKKSMEEKDINISDLDFNDAGIQEKLKEIVKSEEK